MNAFDANIILFVNGFATKSWTFDRSLAFISNHNFIKAGLVVSMLWWAWFCNREAQTERRKYVLAAILLSFAALFLARVLAFALPFRVRPLQNPEFIFRLPYDITADTLDRWSSFPSDHAVMFFALSTSLWFISRNMGLVALVYSALVICLPRIYIGYHYPTDIIAGAFIGAFMGSLVRVGKIRSLLASLPMAWKQRYRAAFYVCYFIVTYEMANLFDDVRELATFAFSLISAHIL
jgi:undecaprenyl-diphosphatase